jgi:hypothetical protein
MRSTCYAPPPPHFFFFVFCAVHVVSKESRRWISSSQNLLLEMPFATILHFLIILKNTLLPSTITQQCASKYIRICQSPSGIKTTKYVQGTLTECTRLELLAIVYWLNSWLTTSILLGYYLYVLGRLGSAVHPQSYCECKLLEVTHARQVKEYGLDEW